MLTMLVTFCTLGLGLSLAQTQGQSSGQEELSNPTISLTEELTCNDLNADSTYNIVGLPTNNPRGLVLVREDGKWKKKLLKQY